MKTLVKIMMIYALQNLPPLPHRLRHLKSTKQGIIYWLVHLLSLKDFMAGLLWFHSCVDISYLSKKMWWEILNDLS